MKKILPRARNPKRQKKYSEVDSIPRFSNLDRHKDSIRERTSRVRKTVKTENPTNFSLKKLRNFTYLTLLATTGVWMILFGWIDDNPRIYGDVTGDRVEAIVNDYRQRVTSSRFGLDNSSLEAYLQAKLPELDRAEVRLPLLSRSLTINTQKKGGKLIWQSAGRLYSVSNDGVVVASDIAKVDALPVIVDGSGLQYKVGDRVTRQEFTDFVILLNQHLITQELMGSGYSFSITGPQQTLAVYSKSKPYTFIVSTQLTPGSQVESAKDLINTLKEQGRSQPSEYLDTSVTGRVFWK